MIRQRSFRAPHKLYYEDIELCSIVKDEFNNLKKDVTINKRKIVSSIATNYNINKKALRGWINK